MNVLKGSKLDTPKTEEPKKEVKVEEPKVEVKTEEKVEAKKPANAQSIGQVAENQSESPEVSKTDGEKSIPEWKFLELKNELKDTRKDSREMKQLLSEMAELVKDIKENGASGKEQANELDKLAEEYGVDPKFLGRLKDALIKDPSLKTTLSKKEEPKEEKKNDEPKDEKKEKLSKSQIEKAVDKQLQDFLKDMPEYKDIVNPEVIKRLVNSDTGYLNKNVADIVEEVYGKTLPEKKSIAGYKAAGPEAKTVDTSKSYKPGSDEWKTIMADPKLKAEYNKNMLDRVSKFI